MEPIDPQHFCREAEKEGVDVLDNIRAEKDLRRQAALSLAQRLSQGDRALNEGTLPQDFRKQTLRLLEMFRARFLMDGARQIMILDKLFASVKGLQSRVPDRKSENIAARIFILFAFAAVGSCLSIGFWFMVDDISLQTRIWLPITTVMVWVIACKDAACQQLALEIHALNTGGANLDLIDCDSFMRNQPEWKEMMRVAEIYNCNPEDLPENQIVKEKPCEPLEQQAFWILHGQHAKQTVDKIAPKRGKLQSDLFFLQAKCIIEGSVGIEQIYVPATRRMQQHMSDLAQEEVRRAAGAPSE